MRENEGFDFFHNGVQRTSSAVPSSEIRKLKEA
jgi:hypothetical protein